MAFLAKLLPSSDVIKAWKAVDDVAKWAKISDEAVLELVKELGEEELPDIEVFAAVNPEDVTSAMEKLKFTSLKRTRFNLFLNGMRAKYDLQHIDFTKTLTQQLPAFPPVPQIGADLVEAIAKATQNKCTGNGVRVAHVLDQASSEEVPLLDEATLQNCRKELHAKLEGEPLESEEFTDSQLTVFKKRTEAGGSPACDYGVLGPYGSRAERRMKFQSVIREPSGTERTIEVAGPDCLETWEACHQIFRSLAVACKVAKLATLENYRSKFKERCREFPSHWGIAMAADVICRTELWPRLKSQQKRLYDDPVTRELAAYDPAMPWDSAIAASTMDADFWSKNFERKALKLIAEGKHGQPIHDIPEDLWNDGKGGNPNKRRRGGARQAAHVLDVDQKRPDGRHYVDKDRKKFCQDFHGDRGCQEPCRNSLSHRCEYCRKPHRTSDCWNKPTSSGGFTQNNGGKGSGGKNKGKGKGKWQGRGW